MPLRFIRPSLGYVSIAEVVSLKVAARSARLFLRVRHFFGGSICRWNICLLQEYCALVVLDLGLHPFFLNLVWGR